METVTTDVLVIGSGFGGAAPALRLAAAGFRVTMIEKGPFIDPRRDFRQTQDPKYLLTYLKSLSGEHLSLTYAEALGGGSGFYEMVSLRAPTQAFGQTDRSGVRLWPSGVDRRALDPHYDTADRMLRVEQIDPHEVPKSGLVFAQMMKHLGYSCERARYAVQGCLGSGFCVTGCVYGAKQSLHMNYLPEAVAAGATVETGVTAVEIQAAAVASRSPTGGAIADIPYRYDVLCRRRTVGGGFLRYRAKLVVLAAGTVGTAKLLLHSRPHLPYLSDQVGRHIAFNGSVKTAGLLPDTFPDGDMFAGRSHPGMISYEFLASRGITITAAKPLPLQLMASARIRLEGDPRTPAGWGAAHVELMRQYRRRMIVLVAFGMTPPLGRMALTDRGEARLDLDLSDDLRAYHEDVTQLLHSILRRNGCRIVEATSVNREGAAHEDLFFSTAHQVGSCRMADRRSHGVVDRDGQVFGYPGLYVTDGAAIPTSLAVNTSLTILANAERIAERIRQRYTVGREAVAAARRRSASRARAGWSIA